jgi:hypothetical protein
MAMNVLNFLCRAGLSFMMALMASYFSAVTFFNYTSYTNVDRAFLILAPALALGLLLFEISAPFWKWIQQRQLKILILFGVLAMIGSIFVVSPLAVSFANYLGLIMYTIILIALMLPAAPFAERFQGHYSTAYYSFGFLLSLIFAYGVVGFLDEAIGTPFTMILFTVVLILAGSVCGYYLIRRAARSFHAGFLNKPLNLVLGFTLPILLIVFIYGSLQFPTMFTVEYISIPQNWAGLFFASALVAGVWGLGVLEQFELRGYQERFGQTKLYVFINQNLPGFYAGGMFFLINLMIARALNHSALSVNSVLFETDAGPWMEILGSPAGDALNRSVHPLVLITMRPLVRIVGVLLGDQWRFAPILLAAAMSGLCVFMAWLFVKRAAGASTYAFIFAILLGSTATHLLFGSLTETYVFGTTSLIFFFLLIQAGENRFSVLLPAGLLLFGITISNIAQGAIGLFFNKFGFRQLLHFCILVIAAGVTLTVLTSALFPNKQTFFFIPGDIAFESNFVQPVDDSSVGRLADRFELVSRTMFLYGVVGPSPVRVIANKDPRPTIDFKTFEPRDHTYAPYRGLANIPLLLWLALLAGSFVVFLKNFRSSKRLPLMLGLLGSLAFNFVLHMYYGTELFLYTPYWTYALVFFVALAMAEFADKKWFEFIMAIIVFASVVNNFWFISVIMRGLAPFYTSS